VRHDFVAAVPGIDRRLEDLDVLTGDLRAAQAADELLPLNMLPAMTSIQPGLADR
jgi:hypothetical protein